MKKILICGGNGQLGYELQRSAPHGYPHGYQCIATDRDDLDISNPQSVTDFVRRLKPDVIINAAAYTAVDKAEEEQELAYAINAMGAGNLAEACKDYGAKLIQVSTDFVFDGKAHSPYPVDAPAEPQGVYGASKQQGDELVQQLLGDEAFIIRTAWLYSAHGDNFVKTMLRLMKERDELGVIADQIGTPTWANSLAQAIWKAIGMNAGGLHHWSDAGVASWYDFAYAIMEEGVALGLLDKPITIHAISTAEYPTPASRPCYSVLDKSATWEALGMKSEHWRVALRRMMAELKKSLQEYKLCVDY